jgi:hypothetical protein
MVAWRFSNCAKAVTERSRFSSAMNMLASKTTVLNVGSL